MSWQMTLVATLFAMAGGLALIWGAMWWAGWFRLDPLRGGSARGAASPGPQGSAVGAESWSAAGAWHSSGTSSVGDSCSPSAGDGGGCGGDGGGS